MATLIGLLLAVSFEKAGIIWQGADKFIALKKGNLLVFRLECFEQENFEKEQNLKSLGMMLLLVVVLFMLNFLGQALFGAIGAGVFSGFVLFCTLGAQKWDEIDSPYVSWHEQYFAEIFWFACLGVTGCVVYWYLRLMRELILRSEIDIHKKNVWLIFHGAMAWIPARLTGLFFALTGNFVPGFLCWREKFKYQAAQSGQLLDDCGQASLEVQHGDTPEQMIHRTFVLWLIFAGLISLFIEFI